VVKLAHGYAFAKFIEIEHSVAVGVVELVTVAEKSRGGQGTLVNTESSQVRRSPGIFRNLVCTHSELLMCASPIFYISMTWCED